MPRTAARVLLQLLRLPCLSARWTLPQPHPDKPLPSHSSPQLLQQLRHCASLLWFHFQVRKILQIKVEIQTIHSFSHSWRRPLILLHLYHKFMSTYCRLIPIEKSVLMHKIYIKSFIKTSI